MKADALRGHLESLILAVVDDQPLHGYGIIEALRSRSGGQLDVPSGTVYPALRRLESAGYLTSGWSADGQEAAHLYPLELGPSCACGAKAGLGVVFRRHERYVASNVRGSVSFMPRVDKDVPYEPSTPSAVRAARARASTKSLKKRR